MATNNLSQSDPTNQTITIPEIKLEPIIFVQCEMRKLESICKPFIHPNVLEPLDEGELSDIFEIVWGMAQRLANDLDCALIDIRESSN